MCISLGSMNIFGREKWKMSSASNRGLCDYQQDTTDRASSAATTSHVSVPASSSSIAASSSEPPTAYPYYGSNVPSYTPSTYEPPLHDQPVGESEAEQEVKFFTGGNENKTGEQEIGDVEVGNSSNGIVSPMFGNNKGKIDINVGYNKNKGQNQKIGKVSFGNVS